ncbi:hypothetical protein CC78DRAFT_581563 [Lojkania enalia]|uniref:Uncharacterized protein n=1 Tax=Lojkania enalia TaxID=147567 RepID=A0A9P4KBJ7_9PLEO|nr:hypothetical protein CC78DRAFT_581563 [Didymosphaeria enalia]
MLTGKRQTGLIPNDSAFIVTSNLRAKIFFPAVSTKVPSVEKLVAGPVEKRSMIKKSVNDFLRRGPQRHAPVRIYHCGFPTLGDENRIGYPCVNDFLIWSPIQSLGLDNNKRLRKKQDSKWIPELKVASPAGWMYAKLHEILECWSVLVTAVSTRDMYVFDPPSLIAMIRETWISGLDAAAEARRRNFVSPSHSMVARRRVAPSVILFQVGHQICLIQTSYRRGLVMASSLVGTTTGGYRFRERATRQTAANDERDL